MNKNKVKIVDGFWLDLSKVVGMKLDKTDRVVTDKDNKLVLSPVFSVIALTSAGALVLLTDETSGVNTKCEKFILDNWVNKE
jgi:hypothetical protein